jgi:polyphosphate kinase
MQRNFFGRVEVCFPIERAPLRERVVDEAITCYLDDNSQAWELRADGGYRRLEPDGAETRRAQEMLLRRLTDGPA